MRQSRLSSMTIVYQMNIKEFKIEWRLKNKIKPLLNIRRDITGEKIMASNNSFRIYRINTFLKHEIISFKLEFK